MKKASIHFEWIEGTDSNHLYLKDRVGRGSEKYGILFFYCASGSGVLQVVGGDFV